mgnify:CR=1 FL=1
MTNPVNSLRSMNPALTDESDPRKVDPDLDPFNPANGYDLKARSARYSPEFAKRFYFVTLRFGIIEDTGGAGFNLSFLDDRLELKADLFQFGSRDRFGNAVSANTSSLSLSDSNNGTDFS